MTAAHVFLGQLDHRVRLAQKVDGLSGRTRRSEEIKVADRRFALGQHLQHLAADHSGRADDGEIIRFHFMFFLLQKWYTKLKKTVAHGLP